MLSRPMDVYWAGWRSNTAALQMAGWEISAHEDICERKIAIAIRHKGLGMQAISRVAHYEYFHLPMHHNLATTDIHIDRIAAHVVVHMPSPMTFRPVDAQPQWAMNPMGTSLDDLAHFAPSKLSKVIVMDDPSVDDLLARILDKQQEAKTAYFREQLAKEGATLPDHYMHAQVISLRKAA